MTRRDDDVARPAGRARPMLRHTQHIEGRGTMSGEQLPGSDDLDAQLDRAALATLERFPLAELDRAQQARAALAYAERFPLTSSELRRAH